MDTGKFFNAPAIAQAVLKRALFHAYNTANQEIPEELSMSLDDFISVQIQRKKENPHKTLAPLYTDEKYTQSGNPTLVTALRKRIEKPQTEAAGNQFDL